MSHLRFLSPWLESLHEQQKQRIGQSQLRKLTPYATSDKPYELVDLETESPLINLSSNDYLALATHEKLRQAATKAASHTIGGKASRLAGGDRNNSQALETRFATFKHAEAALLFPTGYMANLAVLSTLTVNRQASVKNLICMDKLSHASLIDGARLSGQQLRTYPHGPEGLVKLRRLLDRFETQKKDGQTAFIVTDSIFSMDGDPADLPELCRIAETYKAVLIVDEAHGTGVFGKNGSGLIEATNMIGRVPITISTASKAMGGMGGVVTGPKIVIDTLINGARSFIYTTAVPPSQIAAIDAALDVIASEPWRREVLLTMCRQFTEKLLYDRLASPIIPIVTGTAESAMQLARVLKKSGFLAPAIRPPTVAPNQSRVRISLRCDLPDEAINRLLDVLDEEGYVTG